MFGVQLVILLSAAAAQLLPQEIPVNLIEFASTSPTPTNMLLNVPQTTVPQDDLAGSQCQPAIAARVAEIDLSTLLGYTKDPCLTEQGPVVIPSPEPITPKFVIPQPQGIQTMDLADSMVTQVQQEVVVSDWWRPTPGLTWQYQLQGRVDVDVPVDVFVLSLFEIDNQIVSEIQQQGGKVICYFSAGVYEDWNADALDYPQKILGKPVSGWPGERWIDIRVAQQVRPLMAARLNRAVDKNCDGVLLDHLDAYEEDTGFALAYTDQVDHNNKLAQAAHERGLAVGIQNAVSLIPQMESNFDFAVSENCNAQNNCLEYRIFTENNKAVFAVEYVSDMLELLTWGEINEFCQGANAAGLSGILKRLDLMEARIPCPP